MRFKTFWIKFKKTADKILKIPPLFLIAFYKTVLRGGLGLGGGCYFYPGCGDYAFKAYQKHPFARATKLVLRRLLLCNFLTARRLSDLAPPEEKLSGLEEQIK